MQTATGEDPQAPVSSEYCAMVIVLVLGDIDAEMRKEFIIDGVFDHAAWDRRRVWLCEQVGVPKYHLMTYAWLMTQDNAPIHAHMRCTAANSSMSDRMRQVAVSRKAHGILTTWYHAHLNEYWDPEIAAEQASGAITAAVAAEQPNLTARQRGTVVCERTLSAALKKMAHVPEATALTPDEWDTVKLYPTAHTLWPHQCQPLGENMCDMNTPAENVINWFKGHASEELMKVVLKGGSDMCLDHAITYTGWLQQKADWSRTEAGKRTCAAAVEKSKARVQLVAADRGAAVEVEQVRLNKKTGEITRKAVLAQGTGGAWNVDRRFAG